jgi:PKD repeat protein
MKKSNYFWLFNPLLRFSFTMFSKFILMKRTLLLLLIFLGSRTLPAQTPDYYFYEPSNAGVNNLYLNPLVSYKFIFIFTQSELASTGMAAPTVFHSLWLKSNTGYDINIDDFKITLGHTTQTVPVEVFADNFDAGSPEVVLDEPGFNVTFAAGPWNSPPDGWTEIPLPAPFTYNFTDHLAIQMEYSDINYPIPLYANNGGAPLTQYTAVYGGSSATGSTARPMFGFTTAPASPVAIAASDSSVCEKFCVDFTDLSFNDPVEWSWTFEGGSPAFSSEQNPVQICYNDPGTYDVTLITTSSLGEMDTLTLPNLITTFATPPVPVITQAGNVLTSSESDFYQWQLNTVPIAGATNQVYEATESGLYTVITSDSSGCFSSASLQITLTAIENVLPAGLDVYPNPSTGDFVIRWTGGINPDQVELKVMNAIGRQFYYAMENSPGNRGEKIIRLDEAAAGFYFITVSAGDFSLTEKVLISR